MNSWESPYHMGTRKRLDPSENCKIKEKSSGKTNFSFSRKMDLISEIKRK